MIKNNLRELNENEVLKINGGAYPLIPVGIAIWIANEVTSNWSDVKSGAYDAYNDFLGDK
jgi:hypothetical protein